MGQVVRLDHDERYVFRKDFMVMVWVNGCFDVLHRGHFEMLKYAKSIGDHLIVGIDSDNKVRRDKGANRPFNSQQDRKFALESIRYVDKVVIFHSKGELESWVKSVLPTYLVVGSDWRGKEVVGEGYTQKVCFFDRIGDYSTTKILEGIK